MVTSKDHDGTQQVIRRWSGERLDLKIDQLHHLNTVGQTELREGFVDRPDPAQQLIVLGSAYHVRIECERRLSNRFEISRDDGVLGIGHTPRREACPEMMYSWVRLSAREVPWPTSLKRENDGFGQGPLSYIPWSTTSCTISGGSKTAKVANGSFLPWPSIL